MTAIWARRIVWMCVISTAACRTESGSRAALPQPPTTPAVPISQLRKVVADLHLLAADRLPPADELDQAALDVSTGRRSVADIVDRLLASEAASEYAPSALFPWETGRHGLSFENGMAWSGLLAARDGEAAFYHLADLPPCKPGETESVRPWWDPDTEIRVCPGVKRSVRSGQAGKTRKTSKTGKAAPAEQCTHVDTRRVMECGCGPWLMLCLPMDQQLAFARSALGEFTDTISRWVREDRSLQQWFAGDETVRDVRMERVYRRTQVQAGGSPDHLRIERWADGSSPRPPISPGHHAGLLSTPHALGLLGDPRERLMVLSELIWCIEPKSSQVTAEGILSLPTNFRLAVEGWEQLARMPVCDGCHARLDHGVQFFRRLIPGYHYDRRAVPDGARMKLYLYDQHDLRGEAEQTPAGFAQLAVAQPEFGQCMARRVARHVFGRAMTPDDVDTIHVQFESKGTYRAMMAAALVRYAELRLQAARPVAAPAESTTAGVRVLLEQECSACHDEGGSGERVWSWSNPALDRRQVAAMLDSVGQRRMPPGLSPLAADARDRLLAALAADLWPGSPRQKVALGYYRGDMNNVEVHRRRSAVRVVTARVGVDFLDPGPLDAESGRYSRTGRERQEYTPDYAVNTLLDAIDACERRDGRTTEDTAHCVERSVDLDAILPATADWRASARAR